VPIVVLAVLERENIEKQGNTSMTATKYVSGIHLTATAMAPTIVHIKGGRNMKKALVLMIALFIPVPLMASPILGPDTWVLFKAVNHDTINGNLHRLLPVELYDPGNNRKTDFATIDLDQFGFPPERSSQLEIYVTDWVRDRVLFADTRQVRIPDFFVLDLRTRTIYRPESDILDQVYGDIYMTPNCRYIVCFRQDYFLENETNQSFHQNPEILSTLVIDAETFMLISRLNAFSASMNSPSNFFFSGDTTLYIANPFVSHRNSQLVKLSLPSLSILDTLFLNLFCSPPCTEAWISDVGNDLAVFSTKYANGDSTTQAYKAVSTISKGLLGQLPIMNERLQSPARVSPDGQFIVMRAPDNGIEVFNREFAELYTIDSVAAWRIPIDSLGNVILRVSPIDSDEIEEYEISTGRLIKDIKEPDDGR
jgi:hypothetical protein